MGSSAQLARLLEHPTIWRGASAAHAEGLASGFAALDACLPGKGWPRAGLIEILVPRFGSGELYLLLPALAALTRARCARWCVWVAPPLMPFAPALASQGMVLDRVAVVNGARPLWALEQALGSGACDVALAWVRQGKARENRRLQLAARRGAAPVGITGRHVAGGRAGELWAGLHLPGINPQKLQQLAVCAQRFTPRVSLAPPDGLLLEVQGSLHLFAGVAGLRGALRSECLRLQVQPVLAFAPAALAALVAARAGKPLAVMDPAQLTGQLAPLPLASLRWPPDTLARLARMGVRTIGAALRLPRAGFARRVGSEQLAMLDVLTGRMPEARVTFHAPERFRRRRELDCELENHALLLAALAPLFADLGAFLRARQCGVVELECRLTHRHVPATRCVVRLAASSKA